MAIERDGSVSAGKAGLTVRTDALLNKSPRVKEWSYPTKQKYGA